MNKDGDVSNSAVLEKITCTHCGEICDDEAVFAENYVFCCQGCEVVYTLLHESGLGNYYSLDSSNPGISMRNTDHENRFEYLDNADVSERILDFTDGKSARVTLKTPQIHCASCIWLLENLNRINSDVHFAEVFFDKREVAIRFNIAQLPLSKLAGLLTSIGYKPEFRLDRLSDERQVSEKTRLRPLYLKIGIAGFAFGNIMLFSLPEYLSGSEGVDAQFLKLFGMLNIALALPVFLYSEPARNKS